MLKKQKATDPLVNMNVIENTNTGEALLDFIGRTRKANMSSNGTPIAMLR